MLCPLFRVYFITIHTQYCVMLLYGLVLCLSNALLPPLFSPLSLCCAVISVGSGGSDCELHECHISSGPLHPPGHPATSGERRREREEKGTCQRYTSETFHILQEANVSLYTYFIGGGTATCTQLNFMQTYITCCYVEYQETCHMMHMLHAAYFPCLHGLLFSTRTPLSFLSNLEKYK